MKSQLIGKDPDAQKDRGQEEKEMMTEGEMVGWHHWLNGQEAEQTGDSERQGDLVCCRTWGHKESDTTELLNNKQRQGPFEHRVPSHHMGHSTLKSTLAQ